MIVNILACAEQELIEAVDYYNTQCLGLGYEFAAEVTNTLERIPLFQKPGHRSPIEPGGASPTNSLLELSIKSVTKVSL